MPKTTKWSEIKAAKGALAIGPMGQPDDHQESVDHARSPDDRPLERDFEGVTPDPNGTIDQRMAALREDHKAMGAR